MMDGVGARTRSRTRQNSPLQPPADTRKARESGSESDDEEGSGISMYETPTGGVENAQLHVSAPVSGNNSGMLGNVFNFFENKPPWLKISTFVAVLGIILTLTSNYWTKREPETWKKSFESTNKLLKSHFNSQSADTTTSLHVSLWRILNAPEPTDPSSMIVLVPPKLAGSSFSRCFVKVYGQFLNQVKHPDSPLPVKVLDDTTFQKSNVTEIYMDLRTYFHNGGAAVVVLGINGILQQEYLTVFHRFCDSTHAPVKRAVYFFLVEIPDDLFTVNGTSNSSEVEKLGNEILEKAWENVLPADKIYPLLNRVGSWGTILLNEGDSCSDDLLTQIM